jgi:hypothetical protein
MEDLVMQYQYKSRICIYVSIFSHDIQKKYQGSVLTRFNESLWVLNFFKIVFGLWKEVVQLHLNLYFFLKNENDNFRFSGIVFEFISNFQA